MGGGGVAMVRVDTRMTNMGAKREEMGGERGTPALMAAVQVRVMEQTPSVWRIHPQATIGADISIEPTGFSGKVSSPYLFATWLRWSVHPALARG